MAIMTDSYSVATYCKPEELTVPGTKDLDGFPAAVRRFANIPSRSESHNYNSNMMVEAHH